MDVESDFSVDALVAINVVDDEDTADNERTVEGVDDAVESKELLKCWFAGREIVSSESFLLISEFRSFAI